jgi:GH24 family phage-related lysozyme (muramidase)
MAKSVDADAPSGAFHAGCGKTGLNDAPGLGTLTVGLGDLIKGVFSAMPRTSLAERMSRLEQQRARLAEQESKIKADERKQRTRRLIEAGTLVEKAGLLDLDEGSLYGALLSLAENAGDEKQIAAWTSAGKKARDRETRSAGATREPLTVIFPAALPTDFSTRLRGAGLRWNKVLRHWEGMADHETVAALAAEQDGTVSRIDPSPDREKARGDAKTGHDQESERS